MTVDLLTGDCCEVMPHHGPFDLIIADPPYGDTSLPWDRQVVGWETVAHGCLKPTGSMWVFGSMRFFMATGARFAAAGWRVAQDIVWEKHNGSGFAADRFKRVHEHVVQFYRNHADWADVFNEVQTTPDALRRRTTRIAQPKHTGSVGSNGYASELNGPRLMRSVLLVHACRIKPIHPTEKPVGLLEILIRTSCPAGGLVGDFFAGSGAAAEAAATSGRNYVGTEIDPEMAERARQRCAGSLFASVGA